MIILPKTPLSVRWKNPIKLGEQFLLVPAGAKHNVINTSATEALKLYTIYSPPNHKDAVIRHTKEEAETNKEEFDGTTTEQQVLIRIFL